MTFSQVFTFILWAILLLLELQGVCQFIFALRFRTALYSQKGPSSVFRENTSLEMSLLHIQGTYLIRNVPLHIELRKHVSPEMYSLSFQGENISRKVHLRCSGNRSFQTWTCLSFREHYPAEMFYTSIQGTVHFRNIFHEYSGNRSLL
jgi:hypothetical protein